VRFQLVEEMRREVDDPPAGVCLGPDGRLTMPSLEHEVRTDVTPDTPALVIVLPLEGNRPAVTTTGISTTEELDRLCDWAREKGWDRLVHDALELGGFTLGCGDG
jgi:hypothetical protein